MSEHIRYKFVEVSPVTDEDLERVVNEWVTEGWELDGIHFVRRESSYRPAMAFIAFVRRIEEEQGVDTHSKTPQ